uniref:phosphatidylinositol-3,5-bisphosphate 3-phosphatase n=1 Tax=Albugo laibachii Nc14 TaxID=890382 RepID=F0WE34_9STRA|nr:myotubularinlike protein putative [Albugo laibachii Nc14]|eukprot:CCA19463.1 myotubularinlike protein putative [Albugo laibachii Nc14]
MIFQVIRAEKLAAADTSGKSDPFVKVFYDTKEIGVTARVKRNLDPKWDHTFSIALQPHGPMYVVLHIFDHDDIGSNELLGMLRVPFPAWKHHNDKQLAIESNNITDAKDIRVHDGITRLVRTPSDCVPQNDQKRTEAHRRTHSLTTGFSQSTSNASSQEAAREDIINEYESDPSSIRRIYSRRKIFASAVDAKSDEEDVACPKTYIWSSVLRGSTAKGRILCSIQFESKDFIFVGSQPYKTDIQSIFIPENPRFQQVYMHLPSHWNPEIEYQATGLNASECTSPFDCVFPWHEKILYMIEEISVTFHVNELNQGVLATMVLTNYRIWFVPYQKTKGLTHEDVHTISIGKIAKATLSMKKRSNNHMITELLLENMDAGEYRITLSPLFRFRDSVRDHSREAEIRRSKHLQHIVNEIEWLRLENSFFAPCDLTHKIVGESSGKLMDEIMEKLEGQGNEYFSQNHQEGIGASERITRTSRPLSTRRRIRYDPESEFIRQGALDHPRWRVCTLNRCYDLCSSYPSFLMVPSSLQDAQIKQAAMFRSKLRFPALTWLHPRTGASLCRSSQPNTGVLRSTNSFDKELIWAIRDAALPIGKCQNDINAVPKKTFILQIVDARPEINAKSNALTGKGHESVKQYDRQGTPTACITFMGIDNIHVVRNSFTLLAQALYDVEDSNFFNAIQKSRWLEHVCSILQGAIEVATHLERGEPVLVHCSDGWDRTSQLCSLAQVMLDPYYRTMEGFAILIEKDWCSFGHMFRKRCGHPTSDQSSPIFLQFLDAMYQLLIQFPIHFQFNELFLSMIAEAVYSSWFNTFQMNSERERQVVIGLVPSLSVWDILRAATDKYRNPLYQDLASTCSLSTSSIIFPVCRVRSMQLWCSHYQKAIGHMRVQQREIELLALLQQQDQQLSLIFEVLTLEQRIKLRMHQLQSDIAKTKRNLPHVVMPTRFGSLIVIDKEPKEAKSLQTSSVAALKVHDETTVTQSKSGGRQARRPAFSMDFCEVQSTQSSKHTENSYGKDVTESKESNGVARKARQEHSNISNLPNARRRRSAARNRSNSMRLKKGLLSFIVGGSSHTKEGKQESVQNRVKQVPEESIWPHLPSSANEAIQRLSSIFPASKEHSPPSSSSSSDQNKHCDGLKEEMHFLEDQLAFLHAEMGHKEEEACERLRAFRCYNYNIPASALINHDVLSPSRSFATWNYERRDRWNLLHRRNSEDATKKKERQSLIPRAKGGRRRGRLRSNSWSSVAVFSPQEPRDPRELDRDTLECKMDTKVDTPSDSALSTNLLTPGSVPVLRTKQIVTTNAAFRGSQPIWERDGDATCCKRCKKKFKTFYRGRHHCRCCGYVFCGRCTSNRMNLPEFGYYDVVRVCDVCYDFGEG